MRMLAPSIFLCVALALAGCAVPAEFSSPIAPPSKVEIDERLIGLWHAADTYDGDDVAMLRIERGDADEIKALLSVHSSEFDSARGSWVLMMWSVRTAYPSLVDGVTYYNTRQVRVGGGITAMDEMGSKPDREAFSELFAEHPEHGYWLIKADLSGDDLLTLYVISKTSPLVRQLDGRDVNCGEDCKFTLYDLSSEELVEAIRTMPQDELFDVRLGPFARLNEAVPVPEKPWTSGLSTW